MDLDMFPDGVIVAGPDGRVEYMNQRIERMARVSHPGEMVGADLREAVPFDDLNGNSWYDCVRPYDGLATRTRVSESSWYSPRGSEYLITASLIREKPLGPVVRVVLSIRNARIRNARDRERSDLVATVAHELRSPLTGIKGFTATLLSKWEKFSDEQRQFMLETVDADADRLSRLITELLDAARIDAGRLQLKRGPVQLDELAHRVLTNISAGGEMAVPVSGGDDIPVIWGDGDRLTQVVTNLVENAMRHGHGLRTLSVVRTEPDQRPEGGLDDVGVRINITDRGPGIAPEDRLRVFSRFWRTGPGAGSGLGMYIVRGIIEEHGGVVSIGDVPDGGADIAIWVPVNEPEGLTD